MQRLQGETELRVPGESGRKGGQQQPGPTRRVAPRRRDVEVVLHTAESSVRLLPAPVMI